MTLAAQSVLGLVGLAAIAWALSENRKAVPWRIVISGLALQLILALALLKMPGSQLAFELVARAVNALEAATLAGTSFVFGYVGGGPVPFKPEAGGSTFIFAFQALPLILVISALSAVLYYWRILPAVVRGFSWVLRKSMGIGGATGVAAAANIFVGMVEAPLLIRPYMAILPRRALFMVMSLGMATIAGTVLVLYSVILAPIVPGAAGHLLTASLISAPAALMVAALMVPGETSQATETAEENGDIPTTTPDHNAMEAVVRGATEGMRFWLQIVALLIVLVALVALVNLSLSLLPDIFSSPLTLQRALGWAMAPVAWLMGIPWHEAVTAGSLLGTKIVLNELIAYTDLAALPAGALSGRTTLIMTYALCGFANIGSLGIMIGGLGAIAPSRRSDIIALGGKSIIAGTLATCMTGAVAGLLS